MAEAKATGASPAMPPVPLEAEHIWAHFMEAGPTSAGSLGDAPVSWVDLAEYQRMTCVDMSPWEARTLRRLSREFLAERSAATDPLRPAPWVDLSDQQREAVGKALSVSLRAAVLAQKQNLEKRK